MRTQKMKLVVSTLILVGSVGTFSAFAHSAFAHEGQDEESHGMMSGGMGGMMQMMNMMSEMSPGDREAMTAACMNMMQSQGKSETQGKDGTGTDSQK